MPNSNSNTSFSLLSLSPALLTNLASLNYEQMTPIQAQALPIMLNGEDVIAKAHTGSGKTAAFGLTILNKIELKLFAVQGLVLCPTRELAEQISQSIRQLARQMANVKIINLSGGMPMKPQLASLKHGVHIVVGTPGRILKHLNQDTLQLNNLSTLILDEADRMLDMGFLDDIKSIVAKCPKNRQSQLFSATYPPEIKALSNAFMCNAKEIFVEHSDTQIEIEQRFYEMPATAKFTALTHILKQEQAGSVLIFCNTKKMTTEVTQQLKTAGFFALALHGDLEQKDRDLAVIQFINQSCPILVATDVAARGLDIKELPLIINYELAFEADVHTHRIGRTGRAGKQGLAISLVTAADATRICAIEDIPNTSLIWGNVNDLSSTNTLPPSPVMKTLSLDVGKKDKIRPGDILGALTKEAGLPSTAIGKIDVLSVRTFLAIHKDNFATAYQHFQHGKLKGCKVTARKV